MPGQINLPLAFAVGITLLALSSQAAEPIEKDAAPASAQEPVTLDDLRRFTAVFREVQAAYVEPVSNKAMMDAAIFGLLTQLDPHSEYLSREALSAYTGDSDQRYGGLGIEVEVQAGQLKIVSPIDESPAARAGLQAGDVITQIDDVVLDGPAVFQGSEMLRGTIGTAVQLVIERAGAEPFEVTLKREVISIKSARAEILPGNIAWLRISAFQGDTGNSAKAALARLSDKRPLAGVVLDLRNNPGGLLAAAVALSDLFLDSGLIVETKGRQASAALSFSATEGDVLSGAPLVVLINAGTASAAEIVAGALQDHRRALILGQASFGKGSVQSILPLDNGDGVKLTTARYFTPNGRSIQNQGILPDVPLRDFELRSRASSTRPVKEANFARRLDNSQLPQVEQANTENLSTWEKDYALAEALNIVRALAKVQSKANSAPLKR